MGAWGVGMPTDLYLQEFGSQVWHAFGTPPYLVGSALKNTTWRDVDVRVILDDKEWSKCFPGLPPDSGESTWHLNGKWVALTLAFSELGKRMTGLPIDFQIQPASYANKAYGNFRKTPRSSLGHIPLRYIDKRRTKRRK